MKLLRTTPAALLLLLAVLLSGCATTDRFQVSGATSLNACDGTGSHTVSLRIYSLAGTERFNQAEFDPLWDNDLVTLGEDKLGVVEKTVLPGRSQSFEIKRQDGVVAIGIVANFCHLSPGCWKKLVPLEGGDVRLTIHLDKTCMSVD
ncbi:MAG: type VI secretion system lipoprotein TssJ [Candidatus Krumholzibacteriota bacterium]|nr:type VI secretion system lipoprotein TssJ [Candidatus Krumholzibacteriota bacterium]